MAFKKYSDYLQISPTYESVVDIGADQRNANLWREYVVGEDMVKAMDKICASVRMEAVDARRSFWIHGSYGTGKSYAGIVIKHLFEEPADVVDAYMQGNQFMAQFRNRFMPARRHGDYLVIWQSGCTNVRNSTQFLMTVESDIRQALADKYGDKAYYGRGSMLDVVRAKLDDDSINWANIINDPAYGLYEDYEDVQALRNAIVQGNLSAAERIAQIMRDKGWNLINDVDHFKAWVKDIVEGNHLEKSGIFFIWDEFTDYLRFSDDKVALQTISEFCKECPLYMMYIVHKDSSWVDAMGQETYQRVVDRFHEMEFRITENSANDLIANSIQPRVGMEDNWHYERQEVINRIMPYLGNMATLDDTGSKMKTLMERLCPMHPMTIKLLSRVAQSFAAAQRTMFRFMKDQQAQDAGFVGYINHFGPEDINCWLTPDWLWDYFFIQDSDYKDKDNKATAFINHYIKTIDHFTSDENAVRVFKAAMLLMAIMSTTRTSSMVTAYRKSSDGIAATVECLELCFAGVYGKDLIRHYLEAFSAAGTDAIKLDQRPNGDIRLEMPYSGGMDAFQARKDILAKKYTRYQLFAKDGEFSKAIEEAAWSKSDAAYRRMKIAACCAETNSIKARSEEVANELRRFPYKLGLLIVVVKNEQEYMAMQSELQKRARTDDTGRFVYCLLRYALDDKRIAQWLDAVTNKELAKESGNNASATERDQEATRLIHTWVQPALGQQMIAFVGDKTISNMYSITQVAQQIKKEVMASLFPAAPEFVVLTETAYKACQETTPLSGIQMQANNQQVRNVIDMLKATNLPGFDSIEALATADKDQKARAVAKLAAFINDRLRSGARVRLTDLWDELQKPPFGYYDTIACGVLLGFVFRFYVNGAFSWIDDSQNSHNLNENTMSTMIARMVKGKMAADYLSAGSATWQEFRKYAQRLLGLDDSQTSNEEQAKLHARNRITKVGTPYWAVKYMAAEEFGSAEDQQLACKIADHMQAFIELNGNTDEHMSEVLNLFVGRGRLRKTMEQAFAKASSMAAAFRNFVYQASPELKIVAERLALQPIELNDRITSAMQAAVYTWTEQQVVEKLVDITQEYLYIDALNSITSSHAKDITVIKRDLNNVFRYLRIPVAAIETLNKPWFEALAILFKIAQNGFHGCDSSAMGAERGVLQLCGKEAWQNIGNAQGLLKDLLNAKHIEHNSDELQKVFMNLQDNDAYTPLPIFERALNAQLDRIKHARDCARLKETWHRISNTESIRAWETIYSVPLQWVVSIEMQDAVRVIDAVQRNEQVTNKSVVNAINALEHLDASILSNGILIENKFFENVGEEYREIFYQKKPQILSAIRLKLGTDVGGWAMKVAVITSILKGYRQAEMKAQKLHQTVARVQTMDSNKLKELLTAFLNENPEYCDHFLR